MERSGEGKVAFITGASSGIGRATSLLFARHGYALVLADIDEAGGRETEAMIRDAGGNASFTACDVADDAAVKRAIDKVEADHGRLDAAFHAAGVQGDAGDMTADCTMDNWHQVIAVNLTGIWQCMRHEIPLMLKGGGGAIVNVASTAGIRGAAFCGVYSASKHGVVGLTRAAALEYASQNIRINAVCPGMTRTPMTQAPAMKEVIDGLVAGSPLQRIGEPGEIGEAALWLCGPGASFVHGQALAVDGALTSR